MALKSRFGAVLDGYSVRWWIDPVLVAVAVGVWCWCGTWAPNFADHGSAYYASVSSFAGICLAGATFTCALFFQSEKPILRRLRELYGHDALASWTWILTALLLSAATPIAAAATAPAVPEVAFAISTASALMAMLCFVRVVLWFRLITRTPEGTRPDGETTAPGAPVERRTTFQGLGPKE